jgi:hypothetical protein
LDFGRQSNFINPMGRTYLFECAKCGYHTTVAGGSESGLQLAVQTIHCLDCRDLHDAITGLKLPTAGNDLKRWKFKPSPFATGPSEAQPPKLGDALTFLVIGTGQRFRWMRYQLACPISVRHRIRRWQQPGKCPKCGVYLDGSGTPFQVWD